MLRAIFRHLIEAGAAGDIEDFALVADFEISSDPSDLIKTTAVC